MNYLASKQLKLALEKKKNNKENVGAKENSFNYEDNNKLGQLDIDNSMEKVDIHEIK